MKPHLLFGQSCTVLTAKLVGDPQNRSKHRVAQSQAARALLAGAVQDRDDMRNALLSDPRDGPLTYGPENTRLWTSVTHRRGFVGAALSETGPVGLDLEVLQDRQNWAELAQVAWPDGVQPTDQIRFYLFWTLWEACLKCGVENRFAEIATKCAQTVTSAWVEGHVDRLRYAFCIDAQTVRAVVQHPV
ncbi:hypothetical protein [Ruegeria sp. ANG-R]|uniref:4'-phosphopantetheinyl transferase family protein n=1 Tax=Ruegeria sp. ANG-R TaxID=1577903 RepID=UPI000A7DE18B|nr:hypothetical protein [Ruegeria sp. ANG-R]